MAKTNNSSKLEALNRRIYQLEQSLISTSLKSVPSQPKGAHYPKDNQAKRKH